VDLPSQLAAVVGGEHVLVEPDVTASFATDWTGRFRGRADVVVRPADVAEVVEVLRRCGAAGVPVVAQGGNTGLVGAGVPRGGGVVVSCTRLAEVGDIDEASGQLEAGAGATLAGLHAATAGTPWRFPVDFGARERATVGGMVATNAGGVHAMAHGTMRRRVVGIEAVLADGSVVRRMLGLAKDNTGYDLAGLLCGSEGTLGVVTAARLQLARRPREVVAALVGFADLPAALAAARAVAALPGTEAIELIAAECLDDPASDTLLVECVGDVDPSPTLAAALERCSGVVSTSVATDPARRRSLWEVRDGVPEAILRTGVPVKVDVAVPVRELGHFLDAVGPAVAEVAPGAKVWRFGHAADGNVHVNVTGVDAHGEVADRVEEAVLRLAVACGGTISAEHGVGVAKARWLGLSRSPEELAACRAIKRALDPSGMLNPGVLGLS
jgi:FAD/FMN-containing dehydrogenase